MVVPHRIIRPRIVIQAGHYQVKNWKLSKPSSGVRLTLDEGWSFRKAHIWCVERNDAAKATRSLSQKAGEQDD